MPAIWMSESWQKNSSKLFSKSSDFLHFVFYQTLKPFCNAFYEHSKLEKFCCFSRILGRTSGWIENTIKTSSITLLNWGVFSIFYLTFFVCVKIQKLSTCMNVKYIVEKNQCWILKTQFLKLEIGKILFYRVEHISRHWLW